MNSATSSTLPSVSSVLGHVSTVSALGKLVFKGLAGRFTVDKQTSNDQGSFRGDKC